MSAQHYLFDEEDVDDVVDLDVDDTTFDLVIAPTDPSAVVVRRSNRRRKSVIAYREDGVTIVVAPARMSQKQVDQFVAELVSRLDNRDIRAAGHHQLYSRAQALVDEYFDSDILGGHYVPVTIKWVTNQNSRWGSCTPRTGVIRLSHRLLEAPDYVIDSVLVHELGHLVEVNHGPRFKALIAAYPHHARAEAYLAGFSHAVRWTGGPSIN